MALQHWSNTFCRLDCIVVNFNSSLFTHFLLRSGCNLTSFCILTLTTSHGLQTMPPIRPAKAANAARFGKWMLSPLGEALSFDL